MRKIQLFALCVLCVLGVTKTNAQVEIIQTVAGGGAALGNGGPATAAQLNANYFIALDGAGNLYIADNGNNQIRKIAAATGIITTVAGETGPGGYSADYVAATASKLNSPIGIAVDGSGNIFIADEINNRIREVDGTTGIITTIAGTGTAGFTGDGTAATGAEINEPRGVAVDASGNVYFTDGGGTTTRIRKVTAATGNISTIAGNGTAGYLLDGVVATATEIDNPRGLTVDGAGNVYFADMNSSRIRVVLAGSGIIETVAGGGTAGFAGDGGLAAATTTKLNLPTDVKFDAAGNMYIADVSNYRIRMVNTSGIISTVAGSAGGATAGDGSPATAAAVKMGGPVSVAIMPNPNYFYISDRTDSRIRLVKPNSAPYFTGGTHQTLTLCENAPATSINSLLAIVDSDQGQVETWSAGAWASAHGTTVLTGTNASAGIVTITPTGKTYTPTIGYSGPDTFTVQVTDGYATAIDTIFVTVNPLPVVAPISGTATTVCVGSTITLTDATTGDTWSESTGNTMVAGGIVTGLTPGTDIISYTGTNSCGTATATYNVTVNPLPDAGTISTPGTTTVCTGSTITLTDPAFGGVWSASNGNATVSGGVVTGVTAGTSDDISYSVTNSCGTAVSTVTVNIITLAGAGTSLSGPSVVCVGSSVTLTSTVTGGVWSASNANASVSGGSVTGVTAGTDVVTYSLTNTCGTNNITQPVTVNPLPDAGAVSGLTSVCVAGTITLIDAAGGGVWSASNTNASVSTGGVVTGNSVGTDVISYSVTNSCGMAVATSTVNVVTVPSAGVISGAATVCQGATATLTDPTPGGVWSASTTHATVVGGVVTGVSAGTDVISYTVTFSCGTAFATHAITINPLPAPAAISGGTSGVCAGSGTILTDVTTGGVWSAANANATIGSTGIVMGVTAGTDVISYSVTNGCGTVPATKTITINPIVVPSVTIAANPGLTTCPGTLVNYTANPVNGGSAPVYQWKVNGAILASGSSFIYTPINADVIVCKMASNAACVSPTTASDTVVTIVNPTLVPAISISADLAGDTICIGNSSTYTATTANGGTTPSYLWNVNGTPSATGNPFTYVPASGDIVTCVLTSSYACPLPATATSNSITMTVNTTEIPSVSISVSPGNPSCAGSPVTFTIHSLYGGIPPFYRWTKNGVNVATGPEYIYTPASGDNIYAMMASSATCRTLDSVFSNTINMSTIVASAITVNITASAGTLIASGSNDTLTAVVTGTTGAPTYQWFANGTAITGATNSTYIVTGGLSGTELVNCVAGSGNICATSAISNILSLTIDNDGVMQTGTITGEMKVIPNPNKGVFTMNLSSLTNEPVQVVITNTVGEKVKQFTTNTNTATDINLSQPAGIYFLSATTAQGKYVAKVMVE